jgi:acetyltransferase-like isoleucine patch superfamily enzyme
VRTDPVKIKKYAFIGGGSIILKGVTVGENSIIVAGSVVTRDIPDNEIWGGNPAKFIRKVK